MGVSKVNLKLMVKKIGPQFVPTIRIENEHEPVVEFQCVTPEFFKEKEAESALRYSRMVLETLGLDLAKKWDNRD